MVLVALMWCMRAGQPAQASAHTFKFTKFTSKNGLSGDIIYSIVQDKEGFIWIATEMGLSRFDGTSFKKFTARDGLPSNEIIMLFPDLNGRLWLLPFKDEICYYYKGKIHTKENDTLLARLPVLSERKSICEDANGAIMIQWLGGADRVGFEESLTISPPGYRSRSAISPIHSMGGGIRRDKVAPSRNSPPLRDSFRRLYSFMPASTDNEYIEYGRDIQRYEDERSPLRRSVYAFDQKGGYRIFDIKKSAISWYPYNDSVFFIGYPDGCDFHNTQSGEVKYHLKTGCPVNFGIIDKEGGIWLGTRGYGLFYLPPPHKSKLIKSEPDPSLQVTNFYRAGLDSQILTGSWDSACWLLDARGPAPRKVNAGSDFATERFYPEKGNLLTYSTVGPRYILSRHRIKGEALAFKTLSVGDSSLVIATSREVFELDKRGRRRQIWSGRSTCACCVSGYCYVGTLNGLYVFKRDSLVHDARNTRLLFKGTVTSLAWSYRNGYVWVATSNNGLYCLASQKVVKVFDEQTGLSSDICNNLFTDGSRVFAGTYNGLNIVEPDHNFRLTSYNALDGLEGNNITCVYAHNNLAWVATPEGVSALDLQKVQDGDAAGCSIHITAINAGRNNVLPDTGRIVLGPERSDLEVYFSGVSYQSMGSIRYFYRMTGLRDDWQATTQNFLKYPSLPAGTYRLELYAVNRFGEKSATAGLDIVVKPYWWQLGWVQLAIGLAVVLAVIMLVRWRFVKVRSRLTEKAALHEKIEELEQLALRAQMNPHFIFNSLNSFYQYVINKDLAGASKFMNDFSKLIRLLFEITALKELPLDKELLFLKTYLELERTKLDQSFTYEIYTVPGLPSYELMIPSFIIQPYVENSVRHGIQNRRDRLGTIRISAGYEDGALLIAITDNGVGRAYTAQMKETQVAIHQSRGISLTMERIELYNKTHHTHITVETIDLYHPDTTPAGTTVMLKFPKNDLHD